VIDELLDYFKVYVGLKQSEAQLTQRLLHVFFIEDGLSAQGFKGALELFL
jgi:hypothetical protein